MTTYGNATQLSVTGTNGDIVYIVATKVGNKVDRPIKTIPIPISFDNQSSNDSVTKIIDLKRDTKQYIVDGFLITDTSTAWAKRTAIKAIFQRGGTLTMTYRSEAIVGNISSFSIDDDANRSDEYRIVGGTASSGGSTTLTDSSKSWNTNEFATMNVLILGGKTDNGYADTGPSTTLQDATKTWTTNEWAGYTVTITGGTGAGQTRTISSNDATSLTVSAWTTQLDTTSTYHIELANLAGQRRTINSNTSTQLTVSSAWTVNPDSNTKYQIDGGESKPEKLAINFVLIEGENI